MIYSSTSKSINQDHWDGSHLHSYRRMCEEVKGQCGHGRCMWSVLTCITIVPYAKCFYLLHLYSCCIVIIFPLSNGRVTSLTTSACSNSSDFYPAGLNGINVPINTLTDPVCAVTASIHTNLVHTRDVGSTTKQPRPVII